MPPPRNAHIYAATGRPTIVAPIYFHSSADYEQDNPIIVDSGEWEEVVSQLRTALGMFTFREANLRGQLLTNWPAYRASKLGSVRQFQDVYLRIAVYAVNEAELFYHATCQPHGENDITLQVTLNRYGEDEEIARQLSKLFQVCSRWPAVMSE
jgi:hypothetical protein